MESCACSPWRTLYNIPNFHVKKHAGNFLCGVLPLLRRGKNLVEGSYALAQLAAGLAVRRLVRWQEKVHGRHKKIGANRHGAAKTPTSPTGKMSAPITFRDARMPGRLAEASARRSRPPRSCPRLCAAASSAVAALFFISYSVRFFRQLDYEGESPITCLTLQQRCA